MQLMLRVKEEVMPTTVLSERIEEPKFVDNAVHHVIYEATDNLAILRIKTELKLANLIKMIF